MSMDNPDRDEDMEYGDDFDRDEDAEYPDDVRRDENGNELEYDLAVLERELPEVHDWTPDDVEAALWQYSVAMDLATNLKTKKTDIWAEQLERINDLLFLRDEIQDAWEYWGAEMFEATAAVTPVLQELDERFRLAAKQPDFKAFLMREYRMFRESVGPDRNCWWWWFEN